MLSTVLLPDSIKRVKTGRVLSNQQIARHDRPTYKTKSSCVSSLSVRNTLNNSAPVVQFFLYFLFSSETPRCVEYKLKYNIKIYNTVTNNFILY